MSAEQQRQALIDRHKAKKARQHRPQVRTGVSNMSHYLDKYANQQLGAYLNNLSAMSPAPSSMGLEGAMSDLDLSSV